METDLIQLALDEAAEEMQASVEHLRAEVGSIRTGRASPAMLQNVTVEYYGSQTPLNQVASVGAPQADLLVVQPFDTDSLHDIERGIMQANLGLNPSNDGQTIRVPVPPLSQERREELVEKTRALGEEAKVSIRNTRQETKNQIQNIQQSENLSEDVRYGAEEDLQALTDEHTEKVDALLEEKRDELMDV
ncbi:MAG: ribosome recycling factor [Bacteroidetes bacterium QS_9_68_14]|nr:MAG: ribosome recycling factor [Bacteroidetes bacterium QS_9_68_14]